MSLPLYFGKYPLMDKDIANHYMDILGRYRFSYHYDERRNYMEIRTDDPVLISSLLGIHCEEYPNWHAPNSDWKNPINTLLIGKKTPPNPPPGAMM